MTEMTVAEIVRGRPVYVVRENDLVVDAARYMTEYGVAAVPVLASARVVGLLTERELVTRVVAAQRDPASTRVSDVMVRNVAFVEQDCSCERALAIMNQLQVSHLPVMEGNRLMGCVSFDDLLHVRTGHVEIDVAFLGDCIERKDVVRRPTGVMHRGER